MPRGFFITGTDTGVGKTVITGALIKGLRMRGIYAGGMKPIETGCTRVGNVLYPSDGMFLKKVARMDEAINHITPCCFETPGSPLMASEIEGGEVDIKMIKEELNLLFEAYQTLVIEGIGGILVPIMKGYFVIDLIRELALPLIIVASPSLGTINHTLLTVKYAVQEGITVSGIIINFSKPSDGTIAEQTNPALLQKLIPAPLIGIFPHLKNLTDEVLEKAASRHLDLETLLKA